MAQKNDKAPKLIACKVEKCDRSSLRPCLGEGVPRTWKRSRYNTEIPSVISMAVTSEGEDTWQLGIGTGARPMMTHVR
jgi:hypothetical protein